MDILFLINILLVYGLSPLLNYDPGLLFLNSLCRSLSDRAHYEEGFMSALVQQPLLMSNETRGEFWVYYKKTKYFRAKVHHLIVKIPDDRWAYFKMSPPGFGNMPMHKIKAERFFGWIDWYDRNDFTKVKWYEDTRTVGEVYQHAAYIAGKYSFSLAFFNSNKWAEFVVRFVTGLQKEKFKPYF